MCASPICLVTGCAGFVGRHVAGRFAESGYMVVGVGHGPDPGEGWGIRQFFPAEVTADVVVDLCRRHPPTVCVHAAGPAAIRDSMEDPAGDFRRNTEPWLAVLEGVRQAAPTCHLILISSAAVYGLPEIDPVDESQPCRPVSAYGYHKRICEILAEEYTRLHGLGVSIARLFNVYGPGLRRHLLWDICRRAVRDNDGVVELFGQGDEERDFIHVSDAASAILRIGEAVHRKPTVYNVGGGRSVAVCEVACQLAQHWPVPFEVRFNKRLRAPGAPGIRADINRLRRLGFEVRLPLEVGVAGYAEWFCNLLAAAGQESKERQPAAG